MNTIKVKLVEGFHKAAFVRGTNLFALNEMFNLTELVMSVPVCSYKQQCQLQYCLATVHVQFLKHLWSVSGQLELSHAVLQHCSGGSLCSRCFFQYSVENNPLWRRRRELSSVCELCPVTWLQDRTQAQDCSTSQQRSTTGLLLYVFVLCSSHSNSEKQLMGTMA